jgi:putative membrane protein
MMMGDWGGWGWGMGFGGIFMILFWAVIILGIVALVKWLFSAGGSAGLGGFGGSSKTPLDALKERYARGEINREQYEQMRRDLEP